MNITLNQLVEKIYCIQMKYPQDVSFGALWCPLHGAHIQTGAAVFPLAYVAQSINSQDYYGAATHLANWLSARQEPDGSWVGDIRGDNTTAYQLLALTLAFPLLADGLNVLDRRGMEETILRAAAWCLREINIKKELPAYGIICALAFFSVSKLFGMSKYKRAGEGAVRKIIKKVGDTAQRIRYRKKNGAQQLINLYMSLTKNNRELDRSMSDDRCIVPIVHRAFDLTFFSHFSSNDGRTCAMSMPEAEEGKNSSD